MRFQKHTTMIYSIVFILFCFAITLIATVPIQCEKDSDCVLQFHPIACCSPCGTYEIDHSNSNWTAIDNETAQMRRNAACGEVFCPLCAGQPIYKKRGDAFCQNSLCVKVLEPEKASCSNNESCEISESEINTDCCNCEQLTLDSKSDKVAALSTPFVEFKKKVKSKNCEKLPPCPPCAPRSITFEPKVTAMCNAGKCEKKFEDESVVEPDTCEEDLDCIIAKPAKGLCGCQGCGDVVFDQSSDDFRSFSKKYYWEVEHPKTKKLCANEPQCFCAIKSISYEPKMIAQCVQGKCQKKKLEPCNDNSQCIIATEPRRSCGFSCPPCGHVVIDRSTDEYQATPNLFHQHRSNSFEPCPPLTLQQCPACIGTIEYTPKVNAVCLAGNCRKEIAGQTAVTPLTQTTLTVTTRGSDVSRVCDKAADCAPGHTCNNGACQSIVDESGSVSVVMPSLLVASMFALNLLLQTR